MRVTKTEVVLPANAQLQMQSQQNCWALLTERLCERNRCGTVCPLPQ